MRLATLFAAPLLLATFLSACGDGGGGSAPSASADGPLAVRSISFTSGETETPFEPGVRDYQFRSYLSSPAARVVIDAVGARRIYVQGIERAPATELSLPIDTLSQGSVIEVRVEGTTGSSLDYRFRILPPDFPEFVVSSADPTPGRILMTAYVATAAAGRSFLMVLDETGRTLGFRSSTLPVADFQLHRLTNGTERYAYCEWQRAVDPPKESLATCYSLDTGLRKVATISGVATKANPKGLTDHHDLVLLEDDHYIVAAYVTKVVDNIPPALTGGIPVARTVVPTVIQEVRAGRVEFEWDGSSFPEFYSNAVLDNDFADANGRAEYMHLNSLQLDTDGNLLVSLRHSSQVVKINRATGAIMWRLGGANSDFPLASGQRSSAQHFARRTADGSLSLYDNGNLNTPAVSRALLYRLDETRMAVTDFRAVGYQGIFAAATGSAQFLSPERVFFGWGFVTGATANVAEIDTATQQARFTLKFVNPAYASYRAIKVAR